MKTILVGFDAFSPTLFEKLYEQGKMPNLGQFVKDDGYSRFYVTNPAQSEVSWTSIATGLNPGGHGLFDFVHRNPKNYSLHVSLLPTTTGLLGTQFAPPYTAQTIFDYAVEKGFPATSLWWPATFPARLGQPVHTIPGLGTPDILGRLGVGTYFTTDPEQAKEIDKTEVKIFEKPSDKLFTGALTGPMRKQKGIMLPSEVEFRLSIKDSNSALLELGKDKIDLKVGEWSPVVIVQFKLGFGVSVRGVTKIILTEAGPEPRLYFLPLQIHPMNSAWPYANPRGFIKDVWNNYGPFLTLGWPQDTTGLDEGLINDDQFLALCESIVDSREQIFMNQIDNYEDGVLGIVFDTLDRVQHMFWNGRQDVVEDWYVRLDALYGRITDRMKKAGLHDTRVMVLSDHGFADFDHKVHLNSFLMDKGFLSVDKEGGDGGLGDVDWTKSQAYAVGLNSLYLNMDGREGQGTVKPVEGEAVSEKVKNALLEWKGPDGRKVVQKVYLGSDAWQGPLAEYGPDLVVGYTPGYRASAETGLGKWFPDMIEPNKDRWNADHCMDPLEVQGVIFSSRGLADFPSPSYLDIPVMTVGTELKSKEPPKGPEYADEDQKTVEERLKGLGYL